MADNEPGVREQIAFLEDAAHKLERELAALPSADAKRHNALIFLIEDARSRLLRLKQSARSRSG